MQHTVTHQPPMQSSKEADQDQLKLAREQGAAYQHTLDRMIHHEAHGGLRTAGDYRIGYAVEEAEGLHYLRDGALQWVEPTTENCHLEISVCDAADGRFIPGLT